MARAFRFFGVIGLAGTAVVGACTSVERQFGPTGSGGDNPSASASTTGSTSGSGAGGASNSSSASTGTSSGKSTSTSTGTNTSASSSGTGGAQPTGPQLVKSIPADGDMQAALAQQFFLYFDRPVSYSDATGKITLTSDKVTTPTASQVGPCPDGNANCVAGVFPMPFLDTTTNRLPAGTKHTITIDKSFHDPDGLTIGKNLVVSFTTFAYNPNFFDDSATLATEVGGLDYDPGSQALFLCGADPATSSFTIRRIPIANGVPSPATTYDKQTATGGGPYCYGLDIFDGAMYLAHTYGSRILQYGNLKVTSAPAGGFSIIGSATTLAAPDATLDNVHSSVPINLTTSPLQLLIGNGLYYGAPPQDGILSYRLVTGGPPSWTVWKPAVNLYTPSDGLTLTRGSDTNGVYVYAASGDKIFKIRVADMSILNTQQLAAKSYDPQLRTDSKGRLYVGDGSALTVYDTSGTTGFKTIATRAGIRAGRFGLVEQGTNVTVYFVNFRSSAVIGSTTFNL